MKIALSTDHAGFNQLRDLKTYLESRGYECVDFGPQEYKEDDDYPDFIKPAAQAVANGDCQFGIIFGGSGQGEAIVANRHKGIRCGVYYGSSNGDQEQILSLSRQHNNANMLSLGARFLSYDEIRQAVSFWLETPFSEEERHIRRINKIDE